VPGWDTNDCLRVFSKALQLLTNSLGWTCGVGLGCCPWKNNGGGWGAAGARPCWILGWCSQRKGGGGRGELHRQEMESCMKSSAVPV
jgi:hypothetical protein